MKFPNRSLQRKADSPCHMTCEERWMLAVQSNFVTPRSTPGPPSFTVSWGLLKRMSPESVTALASPALAGRFFGLPRWLSGKEPTCQCRTSKRHRLKSCVRKRPWRRKWQPIPVFSPGKAHGQRRLMGCSPWGWTQLSTHSLTCTQGHQGSLTISLEP